MKAIVFGATGFIGSHVTEQLALAGHDTTAIVRSTGDQSFLKGLGISIRQANLLDDDQLRKSISDQAVVFNCLAYRGSGKTLNDYREVEVDLTRRIVEASAQANARRYLQLSSIVVYGTQLPAEPIDETYPPKPELVIDRAGWEREQIVREAGETLGLDTVILQPVSTIGRRDRASFFYRVYQAHVQDRFFIMGGGKARFSCVDTRDIGRAMVWLGEADSRVAGETFLLKGYDTTWLELKQALDKARGVTARTLGIPSGPAMWVGGILERLMSSPPIDRRTVHALSTDRIYNDHKLRRMGFAPRYSLVESVEDALEEKENS